MSQAPIQELVEQTVQGKKLAWLRVADGTAGYQLVTPQFRPVAGVVRNHHRRAWKVWWTLEGGGFQEMAIELCALDEAKAVAVTAYVLHSHESPEDARKALEVAVKLRTGGSNGETN